MTHEEAYNRMMDGYLVSHPEFSQETFIFMTPTYVIHDENDNDFEETWDVLTQRDNFKTGWFIYKTCKSIEKKPILGIISRKPVIRGPQEELVSHIQGNPCPGKTNCLQYQKLAGETACLLCDVHDDDRLVSGQGMNPLALELKDDNTIEANGVMVNEDKDILLVEPKPREPAPNEKTKLRFRSLFKRRKK